ncbi:MULTISPECIES: hypothetical protein [unclassified Pseudomonas]|uniref:hypothetical protein n=1 Tax=unclassified Pseudomonas TaxID=196821 RepID=UPI001F5B2B75|nr:MULTISPECIES: hypothetical protein [unclassified Pseudomonas]
MNGTHHTCNTLAHGGRMAALMLAMLGLGGCASSMTVTGEPGVKMGDSYDQVLAVISRSNTVTKTVKDQGIRAEGYSAMFKDCRTKYFIFLGADGLQQTSYEPAPQLSPAQNCRQP